MRDGHDRGRHVVVAGEDGCGERVTVKQLLRRGQSGSEAEVTLGNTGFDIVALANSGALLLQGALLNRVALNKQLMKALCDSHRTYNLRQHIQEVVNR